MDTDFDFLSYLDFGGNSGATPAQHKAPAAPFDFDFSGIKNSNTGSSLGEGSSISSTYASPQDRSAGTSEWSASSPSASSTSYTKSPLFGSMPSLFDTSNILSTTSSSAAAAGGFSWDNSFKSDTSNFAMTSPQFPSQSAASSNSPPFDISIYANSFNGGELSNHMNQQVGNNNNHNTNSGHYGAYGQPNSTNDFQAIPSSNTPSTSLAQQWQQLMLQQAQLQLQIQMQNSALQPAQSLPQTQTHINNGHSIQQQYTNQAFHESIPSISLQTAPTAPDMGTLQPQQPQQLGAYPLTSSNTSWNTSSSYAAGDASTDPVITSSSSSEPMVGLQTMPSVFALPQTQSGHNISPTSNLKSTEESATVDSMNRQIAKMPNQKRDVQDISVTPSGTAHHVASLRPGKITKTGLKRSYQQVKQEENSDEEARRMAKAPGLSRSVSADSSMGEGSGEDGKSSKKTPGGHNAVEQKYRRGINDSLIMLREIVPALQHLRATPGLESNKRKQSQFSLATSVTPVPPSGFVDGVMAPTKLSKQLILVTATDYIRFLQNKRLETEGELEAYKKAITDCVEDGSVVLRLVEERWAPQRAEILRQREQIYESRVASKEQSKRQARLERQKNASARKAHRSVSAGKEGEQTGKAESDEDDSDEDGDDVSDEDDAMSDDPSTAKPKGIASAVTNGNATSVKARAGKGDGAKKANTSSRKKSTLVSSKPIAGNSNDKNSNTSKALMSIFAGVSFVGGASYDVLFGSSAATGQQANQSVSPDQVWSRGNILRRDRLSPEMQAATADLPAVQAYFLGRPALLSGLVMLSLSTIIAYILLAVLPAIWARITGSSITRKKEVARQTLARKVQRPESVSLIQERNALAALAGIPSSIVGQISSLPVAGGNFALNVVFGSMPTHFASSDNDDSQTSLSVESAVSAVRWLELSQGASFLSRMSGCLSLYNAMHSPSWPTTKDTVQLSARAHAIIAITAGKLLGPRFHRFAAPLWSRAQGVLKKEDAQHGWLAIAMSLSYDECIIVLDTEASKQSTRPLYDLAKATSQMKLSKIWRDVFTDVIRSTVSGKASRPMTFTDQDQQLVAEIIAEMPKNSNEYALALLPAGIAALQANEKQHAVQIALQMTQTQIQQLTSIRAFCCIVSGRLDIPSPQMTANSADSIAYCAIAWLAIQQIAKVSNGKQAKREDATEGRAGTKAQDESGTAGLQMATLRLRKILSSAAFTDSSDDDFADAQDRCVEGLVNIGRQAAGLEALSDSGCEL